MKRSSPRTFEEEESCGVHYGELGDVRDGTRGKKERAQNPHMPLVAAGTLVDGAVVCCGQTRRAHVHDAIAGGNPVEGACEPDKYLGCMSQQRV